MKLFKKKKKTEDALVDVSSVDLNAVEIKEENPKKKKRKKILFIVIPIVVVLVIAIAAIQILGSLGNISLESTVNEEVLTKKAEKGSIDTTLTAAGSVADPDSVLISVPEKVSITSVAVSNGSSVKEGDIIAYVDKSSALLAIAEIQDVLDELDVDLEEARDEAIESTVKATASGRIKAVFATADESVLTTMYEHDALILISLDGQMAVEISTDSDIVVGNSVNVTASDGTVYSGKVSEKRNSSAIITVSDEKTTYGDEVTVSSTDGTVLGSGTLRINSEQKITGYSGTVKSVSVSVNKKVSVGDTLLTLQDTTYTATYRAMLNQRHKLETQMQELFAIYQSGTITASSDGLISDLDTSLVESKKSSSTSTAVEVSTMSYTGGAKTTTTATKPMSCGYMLTAAQGTPVTPAETINDFAAEVVSVSGDQLEVKISGSSITLEDYRDLSSVSTEGLTNTMTLTVASSVGVYKYADSAWETKALSDLTSGQKIICTFNDSGELVWIVAGEAASTTPPANPSEGPDATPAPTQEPGTEGPQGEGPNGGMPSGNGNENGSGSNNGNMPSGGGNYGNFSGYGGSMNITSIIGQMSGNSSALGQAAAAEAAAEEEAEESISQKYSVSSKDLCSVTPQDEAIIEITIDELDILSLSLGDEAKITLDALESQSFTGTVTKISTDGTNSGGNAKFTVEVTIDRTPSVLSGMNAAVYFVQKTTEDVVTVPAEAIYESGNKVFVYTAYDESEETLTNPVEVTTGVSDGTNVEITSGLNEGDTYVYKYADTITWAFQR